MLENYLICSKCGSGMSKGFVADFIYGAVMPNRWVEGSPEKSFWTGTKVKDKEQYTIKTYRCEGCGFLELYANDEPAEE